MELGGYWRRLLRVNLSDGRFKIEEIPRLFLEKYLGGSALATKYLYEEVPAGQDPWSMDNKLIFAVGPFQGTGVPGSAKWAVVSKSPLTGTFAVSTAGGHWGLRFKGCGYDMLIVEGSSSEPVYLWLDGERAELRPAGYLWGKDAIETTEILQKEVAHGKASVAAIGPAGERGVAIACIVADSHKRLINLGDGLGRQDDTLPARMFEPAHRGFRQGKAPHGFDKALSEYYALRGWDEAGKPTAKKLEELGLQ